MIDLFRDPVAVVGAGYVGLVTGACLAESGASVTLVETDAARREALTAGHSPIFEPGLDDLLRRGMESERLCVGGDLDVVLQTARTVIVAVGTPPMSDGRADLRAVHDVAAQVQRRARPGTVLVIKSTVPPGTGAAIAAKLRGTDPPIPVVSCPEFLREGSAIRDITTAKRVVVGGADPAALIRVGDLMNLSHGEIVTTDNTSAELIKYGSNAFLAMKISFINEMANLCDLMAGDVDDVAAGMGLDERIGPSFLNAGLGFGGSCFPKDVRALDYAASREGYSFWMLKTALEVNEQQRMRFVQKLRDAVGNHMSTRKIAMLGLAFKPGTDDMRQASSIAVAARLVDLGAKVVAHDPVAMDLARPLMPETSMASDPYEAVTGADAVAIVTEWPEYIDLDWARIRSLMAKPIIVDGRNCLDTEKMGRLGFNYHSMGRAPQVAAYDRRRTERLVVATSAEVA